MDEHLSSQESHHSVQQRSHPRRKPADESVSLKRTFKVPTLPSLSNTATAISRPDGSSSSSMDVDAASDASVVVQQPSTYQNHSSGESTNPEKWFEDSNNHIKTWNPSFADYEPPFFLQQSSSENSPPDVDMQRAQEQAQAAASLESLNREDAHSSEGFRSVIDDLTIENKRLKRQLQRYGRLRDSYSHPEALFEVRVHDLPPEKKHELEDLLRGFVSKLDATSRSSTNIPSGRDGVPSSLRPDLTSSTSRVADSGYASWSASGQNSGSPSGLVSAAQKAHDSSLNHERRKDIQSYLSDIPPGLLPYQTGPISDGDKRKIIVRRLEQLFAGRDSSGGHQQPIQQEKVAQSAARADRKGTWPPGGSLKEGAREAPIMCQNKLSGQLVSRSEENSPGDAADFITEPGHEDEASWSSDEGLIAEQRPTRPLDIDPYRAQIPSENMQYMRHLGFSPPDPEAMSAQEDGHGWIYLNVLYNMAQLHLANVPMEVVRKAVNEQSRLLELSPDGRKLRWKGGRGVLRTSSENSPTEESLARRTGHGSKSSNNASKSSGIGRIQSRPDKFAYLPLFHREDSNNLDAGGDHDHYQISNIPAASPIPASSSGIAGGHFRADDAPIIFYQNTAFYTDLSGDLGGPPRRIQNAYHTVSLNPVGSRSDLDVERLRKLEYEKGPLSQLVDIPSGPRRPGGTASSGSIEVLADSPNSNPSTNTPDPMDFEACGLGGVFPADNFAISVRSRQNLGNRQAGSESPVNARRKAYSTQIRHALQKSQLARAPESSPSSPQVNSKSVVQREIIASNTHELPASRLPEGTYFHDSSDEDDDDDDDTMDCESSDEESSSLDDVPMPAPQRMDWATVADGTVSESQDDEDEDDDDEDSDDEDEDDTDESMDLLATARRYDPETVRLKEREFISNIADRLADEIPAGNSAATAEGGSGFNSPEGHFHQNASDRRVPTLKRVRNSDDNERSRGSRAPKSPKVDPSTGRLK